MTRESKGSLNWWQWLLWGVWGVFAAWFMVYAFVCPPSKPLADRTIKAMSKHASAAGMERKAPAAVDGEVVSKQPSRRERRMAAEAAETFNHRTVDGIVRLLLMIAAASFIGAVVEIRNWTRFASSVIRVLTSYARLPKVSGVSMLTALASNQAANAMVAAAFAEGRISRFQMRVSGMCNSYPAYVSHSLRVLYPSIGAAGWPAAAFFGLLFLADFLFVFAVMTFHRIVAGRRLEPAETVVAAAETAVAVAPPWGATCARALRRTGWILLRVSIVTIPLYTLAAYLGESGAFDHLDSHLPDWVARHLSPEVLAVAMSQVGGVVSAAGVAAGLLNDGRLTGLDVLLAFLIGSAATNPVRTIRRNLPTAMGIFPPRDGMFVVLVHQAARLAICLFLIVVLILIR